MSARLAPSSRPLPSLFVAFLPFFVFPWPSPLRVINVIIIAQALLAPAPAAVMLTYLRSPAFLARALDALVGADARPQALLARAPDAVMLAYARSPAFLALALDALVGADPRPQALLARAPDAVMLAYLRSPAFLARAFFTVVLASFVRHDGFCWQTWLSCAGEIQARSG